MPPKAQPNQEVAFGTFLEGELDRSTLSPAMKTRIKGLLGGVKVPNVPDAYYYSCPFPFMYDDVPAQLSQAYATAFFAQATRLDPNADDRTLFEQLFILHDNPQLPRVAVYPAYASGDMYGFAAAMTVDDNMQMILMKDGGGDRPDNSAVIKGLVEQVSGRTVYVGDVIAGKKAAAKILDPRDKRGKKDKYRQSVALKLKELFTEKGKIYCAVDLFFGTRFVALRFSADSRQSHEARLERRRVIRARWLELGGGGDFVNGMKPRVEDFVAKRNNQVLPAGKNIVVLWSRYSGKKGNAHIEYDSSMTGLRQLTARAFEANADIVVLAGDAPFLPDRFPEADKEKRRRFVADLRGQAAGQIIDLLEFWNAPDWPSVRGIEKPKRLDQYKVFEVLDQKNTVKHFGARSGNLEALSLLGYTVRYFEDGFIDEPSTSFLWDVRRLFDEPEAPDRQDPPAASLDKQRMEPWHKTVGYQRIVVSEVPTRSGKYLITIDGAKGDKWTYKARGTPDGEDKPDVSAFSKGFNFVDMTEIERYLRFPPTGR